MKMIEMIGNKYGRLVVIKKSDRPSYWICECECGNNNEVRGDHLRQGKIRSCGCLATEASSLLGKRMSYKVAGKNRKDITGMKFGKLTATRVLVRGDRRHSETWECICECGAVQSVCKSNLLSGHTTSCGCNKSLLEKKVAEILVENKIKFTKNKTFDGCRFENGSLAKFDFFVEGKYVIECDGLQHMEPTGSRFDEETFRGIRDRDIFKESWCKENGIKVVRVSYRNIDKITILDLIP